MQTITVQITGMSCQHCVAAVTKALLAVPGVQNAEVNLDQGSGKIIGTAPVQAILNAVTRAGYEASHEG